MPHSKDFARRKEPRSADPVPIGEVVDALMAEEAFSRGMPVAKLAQSWRDVVGDRLAEATRPASLENGILTIQADDGPWGTQARYLGEQIRKRADEALGGGVVKGVRVTVGQRGPSPGSLGAIDRNRR